MLERDFQAKLVKDLKRLFPDAMVFKNDAKQGMPDILMLCGEKWAALECKRAEGAPHQPNQDWYVNRLGAMGFSSFIYPENREYVIEELNGYFYC